MISILKKIFSGDGSTTDIAEIMARGGTILDVRTEGEYRSGHVKGSVNIPLNVLPQQMARLNRDKPVITCCASGMRSASAKRMLNSGGFPEVYNGGSWASLRQYES